MNLIQPPEKWGQAEWFTIGGLAIALYIAYVQGWFNPHKRTTITEKDLPSRSTKSAEYDAAGNRILVSGSQTTQRLVSDDVVKNRVESLITAFGNNWTPVEPEGPYNAMLNLQNMEDLDLIAAANYYNRKYANSDYPTLAALVDAEYTMPFSTTRQLKLELLARLNALSVA